MAKQKYKILRNLFLVLSKLYKLTSHYKWIFVLTLGFIVLIEVSRLFVNYLFKSIIDFLGGFSGGGEVNHLLYLIVGMVFVYIAISLFEYINTMMLVKIEIKIQHEVTLKIFKKMMGLSLHYHEKENTGAKLTKINRGIGDIQTVFDRFFWDIGPTIIRLIASFVFLMFIDYRMALAFFIIVPFFIYITFSANKKAYPIRKGIWKGYERIYGGISESIYNVKTVQSYVQEEREKKKTRKGILRIITKQFLYIKILFSSNFIRSNLITVGYTIMICLGSYYAYHGEITPGDLVLFLTVSGGAYYSLFSFSRIIDVVMNAKVGIERIFKVLDSDAEIKVKEDGIQRELKGSIVFDNVYFNYGEGDVLKNVNFEIKPGEVVALVGPSGGGKTTIAKLLYRYFDVTKGKIIIDGESITDLDLYNYREQLAIVDQDIDVFDSSVKDNIAYGRPESTMTEIMSAAKIANAHEFIKDFKKGYDTVVGERGIKLSGGQKQRVGIARAVLVNPRILIFDEATSSLDAESEKLIQDAINKVIKNRTTIVIAHRLSTVKNADKIIVIDKGRVLEVGTHKGLIRKRGIYAKLVKLQMSGFLD